MRIFYCVKHIIVIYNINDCPQIRMLDVTLQKYSSIPVKIVPPNFPFAQLPHHFPEIEQYQQGESEG